jgi:hypothetical protein
MSPDLVIATGMLLAIAGIGRALAGTWMSPGPFFASIWGFIVVFSLSSPLFGAPVYPVWAGAVWWIDLQVVTLLVGDLVGQGGFRRSATLVEPPSLPAGGLPYAPSILLFCAVCTFVYVAALDTIEGRGEQPPTPLQIILAFHYAGGIVGGLIFAAANSRWNKILGLMALLPGTLISIYMAGRTAVVAQFTFWFAAYFAMRLYLSKDRVHLFTKQKLLGAVLSLSVFFWIGILVKPFRGVPRGLSFAEHMQRYSEVLDVEAVDDSWEFMKPGYFGHVSSFSWYFERAWQNPTALSRPGEQTFCGIYRLLGIDLTPALYTRVGGVDTNVFTIFKPIIEDYTLAGSILVFFLIGLVAGRSYRNLADGKKIWPAAFLVMFYTNSMNAGGWFFNYNSVTGSYVLAGFYLFWLQSKQRRALMGIVPQGHLVASTSLRS